ncbi:TPA: hypothetical protein ACH3X1_015305 [Trebouxia sp. C0004]
MVEKKCSKCNYIAKTSWAWQQHLNRSTPCDAGRFECRKGCGKPLKSEETRPKHENICNGPQPTREELQAENEEAQAKLASKEETSKLDLAIISRASTSVATKLVSGIQCNPEMVLDVNKLKLHHAVGKEATAHLRGKNIGLLLSASPEQLHKVTLELYAEKATKSFASAVDHSRQQTYASNLQEIKKTREMIRELQHKEEVLMEENLLLSKPQGDA